MKEKCKMSAAEQNYDVEGGEYIPEFGESLLDEKLAREIRFGFIRKVYSIIAVQLALTFSLCLFFMTYAPVTYWVQQSVHGLFLIGGLGGLGILWFMMRSADVTRKFPQNYLLLFSLTLFESLLVGAICSVSDPNMVLQALLATVVVVTGLTLFAWQTDYDFTSWLGIFSYMFWAVFAIGLLRIIFWWVFWLQIFACVAFAFCYGIYILLDTHLLIKRGKVSFEEDDYILAALSLYVDIVGLFVDLLRLLTLFSINRD